MTMPDWFKTGLSVVLALPFGWGLGVLIAWVIAGPDFGQLPAATIGVSVLASLVFALWPSIKAATRLSVLFFGGILLIAIARMIP